MASTDRKVSGSSLTVIWQRKYNTHAIPPTHLPSFIPKNSRDILRHNHSGNHPLLGWERFTEINNFITWAETATSNSMYLLYTALRQNDTDKQLCIMTFNRPRLISLSKHTNLGGKGEPDLPYFDQGYLQALGTSTWSTLNEHCIKVWSTYLYIWNKIMKQVTAIFLTASWQPREIMGEWIKNSQQLCTRNTRRQTNIRRKDTVFVLSKCYDCTCLYLLQAMSTINTL